MAIFLEIIFLKILITPINHMIRGLLISHTLAGKEKFLVN